MEVKEVSTTIIEAKTGKSEENIALQDVDFSVEVLDLEEETGASSDADPTVEVLEESIDEVVIGESLPARARAVEDKMDTSKVGADDALRKRKSVDKEDLLEEMEVMSIEEVEGSSPVKKRREKSGIKISPCSG